MESLRSKLANKKKKDNPVWSLYIDLKSAFDTVDHELMFQKMLNLGVSEELHNTIRWLYDQTKIKVGEEEIGIGRGVIQGGVLSPLLFLIAFNDLIT